MAIKKGKYGFCLFFFFSFLCALSIGAPLDRVNFILSLLDGMATIEKEGKTVSGEIFFFPLNLLHYISDLPYSKTACTTFLCQLPALKAYFGV